MFNDTQSIYIYIYSFTQPSNIYHTWYDDNNNNNTQVRSTFICFRKPYSTLFIALDPGTDDKFRLRGNIIPDSEMCVYSL